MGFNEKPGAGFVYDQFTVFCWNIGLLAAGRKADQQDDAEEVMPKPHKWQFDGKRC